jgi:hypothetical protein
MLQGYIVDPETGKVVAVILDGEVFRDDKERSKIAVPHCSRTARLKALRVPRVRTH